MQFAADADRIRNAADGAFRVHICDGVNRVLEVGGQDVNDQILNRPHHITRHQSQRQLHVFLELGFLVVNGREHKRPPVEQTDRKAKVLRENRWEIRPRHGISARHRHLHNCVLKRVRHLDVHLHTTALGDVQFRRCKTDLHVRRS